MHCVGLHRKGRDSEGIPAYILVDKVSSHLNFGLDQGSWLTPLCLPSWTLQSAVKSSIAFARRVDSSSGDEVAKVNG